MTDSGMIPHPGLLYSVPPSISQLEHNLNIHMTSNKTAHVSSSCQ